MKKFFTLICALVGFAGAANAAKVDDIAVTKHSYVLVCDELGTRPGKGVLFGNDHFLDVTGGSTSTGKGAIDLSVADGVLVTEEIAAKYGEYGKHYNFLRLKKTQDVIAMKVTAQSKIIIFYQDNGKDDRYPVFAKDAGLKEKFAEGTKSERVEKQKRIEWTATDDGLVYIGDNNGDMYVSFIIVEANEAPGTPTVKVGDQKFEGGLWFREVTCKANDMVEEGSTEKIPTVVYYTTDGTDPTTASTKYSEPIKCYKDMTVKFQAYMDLGLGEITEDDKCANADNEGNVNFTFNAPSIAVDGSTFAITSEYAEQNGVNYYTLNGGEAKQGDGETLELGNSAIVEAYTKISNGTYGEFISKSSSTPVYAMKAIKDDKSIAVTGFAVEQTAEDGTISYVASDDAAVIADKEFFFLNKPEFGVLATADDTKSIYQVPVGQEVYIKMNKDDKQNGVISFLVAAGDSVTVTVTCSKNSCKNIDEAEEEVKKEGSKVADNRKCFINVNGTNYGGIDLVDDPTGNVVKFGLKAGEADEIFTFMKYSGTGNILVSSIAIAYYGSTTGIENIATVAEKAQNGAIYNLAGQKVSNSFKGIVIQNGKKIVK